MLDEQMLFLNNFFLISKAPDDFSSKRSFNRSLRQSVFLKIDDIIQPGKVLIVQKKSVNPLTLNFKHILVPTAEHVIVNYRFLLSTI